MRILFTALFFVIFVFVVLTLVILAVAIVLIDTVTSLVNDHLCLLRISNGGMCCSNIPLDDHPVSV